MKRSIFHAIFSLVALAAVSMAAATANLLCSCRSAAARFMGYGLALFDTKAEPQTSTAPLVRAKRFLLRILKRERPVVTGAWRMCPSV